MDYASASRRGRGVSVNPKLSEHLDQRIELLKSLKELSVQQHEAIDSRRTDDLLRLLSRRERLTESLLSGASGFDRAVIEWKSTDQSDAAYLNSRIEEAESLLKEILDRDAQDEAAIRETRGEISEEIAGVGHHRRKINLDIHFKKDKRNANDVVGVWDAPSNWGKNLDEKWQTFFETETLEYLTQQDHLKEIKEIC